MKDSAERCADCGRKGTGTGDENDVDPVFGVCRDIRSCAERAGRVQVRTSEGTAQEKELWVVSKRSAPFTFAHTIYTRAELEALRAQIDRALA